MEDKPETIKPAEKTAEQGINKVVYVVMGIALFAVVLFILVPNINLSDDFTYKSPSGEGFDFVTGYVGKIPVYTLKLSASYGDKLTRQYEIPLRNKPKDLENIPVEDRVKSKLLSSQGIFITLDPELDQKATIAAIQLAKVLGTADYGVFKIPTQGAFTQPINTTNQSNYPVKTCQDATSDIMVIQLTLGMENKAYIKNNCVIIEATDTENLIKVSEKVVLRLLGVM